MYNIISYTIYITTCIVVMMVLLFQSRKDYFTSFCFFRMQRLTACFLFLSVPFYCLSLYRDIYGLEWQQHDTFIQLYMETLSIGLFLTLFSSYFLLYNAAMRLQRVLMWLYIAAGVLHPIMLAKYVGNEFQNTEALRMGYRTYLDTLQFRVYGIALAVLAVCYITVCVYTSLRFLRKLVRWNADKFNRQGLTFSRKLFAIIAVHFFSIFLSYYIGYAYDLDYSYDLPVWSLMIVMVAIVIMNSKEEYVRFVQTYVKLEIQGSLVLDAPDSADEGTEMTLQQRERQVVLRELHEWYERTDCTCMAEDYTLSSLSEELAHIAVIYHVTVGISG